MPTQNWLKKKIEKNAHSYTYTDAHIKKTQSISIDKQTQEQKKVEQNS